MPDEEAENMKKDKSKTTMPLSELKPGDEATISEIGDDMDAQDRLLELGLNRGTPIRVIKFAPLGDPIEINVRGYYLSIRKDMARHIRVRRRRRGRHFGN